MTSPPFFFRISCGDYTAYDRRSYAPHTRRTGRPAAAPSIVIVAMFIHQFGLDHLLFHQLRVDEGELRCDRYPLISENGFYVKQLVHPAVIFYTLGLTGERLAITLHELVLAYAQLHLLRTETAAGLQRASHAVNNTNTAAMRNSLTFILS